MANPIPCKIDVSADRLSAKLTVAPDAPDDLTPGILIALLAKAGVVFGVDAAAVGRALAAERGQAVEVARGQPPVHGTDATLEALVQVNRERHPQVDGRDQADFRDLGAIPCVSAGQTLMRRHPPGAGQPGRDVRGTAIAARPGKDAKFAVRLEGVATAPADPDMLVAQIDGQPILQRDGISVEPVVRLDRVDLSSGNVEFLGSVEIKGDVVSGMKIHAGGDVTIGGVLEAATVECGGNLTVRGGILGHAAQSGGATAQSAAIQCKGSLVTRYIENAVVEAGQSVTVEEAAIQSEITALDTVTVGKRGSHKGRILGGTVRATLGVSAEAVGGPGSGPTRVLAGVNPLLLATLERERGRVRDKLKEHAELSKVVKLLGARKDRPEMLAKARLTLKKVEEEITEALADGKRLEAELKLADTARVEVTDSIQGGSRISLGRKTVLVHEDRGGGVFSLVDGEVVESAP